MSETPTIVFFFGGGGGGFRARERWYLLFSLGFCLAGYRCSLGGILFKPVSPYLAEVLKFLEGQNYTFLFFELSLLLMWVFVETHTHTHTKSDRCERETMRSDRDELGGYVDERMYVAAASFSRSSFPWRFRMVENRFYDCRAQAAWNCMNIYHLLHTDMIHQFTSFGSALVSLPHAGHHHPQITYIYTYIIFLSWWRLP